MENATACFGAFAAGGGLGIAAAALDLSSRPEAAPPAAALVSGHAWGGGIVALGLLGPPGAD